MNQDWEEKNIRELFQRLKREDERVAPSFAKVWGLARTRHDRERIGVIRYAMAIALVAVCIASALFFFRHSANERIDESSVSLSAWKPPTDVLLTSTRGELVRTVPRFGEPLFQFRSTHNN